MSQTFTTRQLLTKLVAFDTTSRGSNLALIDFVENYLHDHGVTSRRTYDPDATKANLFATIGPDGVPGVVLSGHTDVVPVDGQDWCSDPWTVTERDGNLYGRGTADMKGFIASALAAVPAFTAQPLASPVHLAFSFDEEVGCLGVRHLIEDLDHLPVQPRMCLVGEPTLMALVDGHKGKESYRIDIKGREAHSSLPHLGANAVDYAAKLVVFLRQMADERRKTGPFNAAYDPKFTTIHTGVMNGGTALNIVPNHSSILFEWRYIPEDDVAALLATVTDYAATLEAQMQAEAEEADISISRFTAIPALKSENHDALNFFRRLTGENRTEKVSFGTEAGLFEEAGMSVVVCGPGSISVAHKADEYVALSELQKCDSLMAKLVAEIRK